MRMQESMIVRTSEGIMKKMTVTGEIEKEMIPTPNRTNMEKGMDTTIKEMAQEDKVEARGKIVEATKITTIDSGEAETGTMDLIKAVAEAKETETTTTIIGKIIEENIMMVKKSLIIMEKIITDREEVDVTTSTPSTERRLTSIQITECTMRRILPSSSLSSRKKSLHLNSKSIFSLLKTKKEKAIEVGMETHLELRRMLC